MSVSKMLKANIGAGCATGPFSDGGTGGEPEPQNDGRDAGRGAGSLASGNALAVARSALFYEIESFL